MKGLSVYYTVGDVVSANHYSRVKIIDRKTRRVEKMEGVSSNNNIAVVNPPGSLSLNAFTMLKAKGYELFEVIGEEDLLVLVAGREGDVAYGQPGVGVVVLNRDSFYLSSLLKGFKPDVLVLSLDS